MKDIDSFGSLVLKPFSDTHILPEMFNEVFQMDNCPEHVTAHTELFLNMNTSNMPRQAVSKRQGQEWVTGTPRARAGGQNGSTKISSGPAGGCVDTASLFNHYLRGSRETPSPKASEHKNLHRSHCHLFFFSVWLHYNFAQISEKYWLCLSLFPGTVTNPLCGLGQEVFKMDKVEHPWF